jgi:acyl carrier protein
MRMYRTGDRARWTSDGVIEFEGRVDAQVKVRGFRIEPGEIEAVLAAHPDVRACVVVPRPDATGALELIAFCETSAAPDALRAHLRSRLPDYMVPGRIARLDSLPVGPAGKVDRDALQTFALPADADEYHAPRTETERTLAGIWTDVIGVERVSVHSRFFDIGGHSLMAMRIMSRVQESFGIRLPLNVVFDAPSVAQMSAAIAAARASAPVEPAIGRISRQARQAPRAPGTDPASS